MTSPGHGSPSGSYGRLIVLAVLAVIVVAALVFFDIRTHLGAMLGWIEDQGGAGVVIFLLLYVAAAVLFVPGSILTLGAGAVYGVVKGSVLVSLAATLGACAAFLVGRYLARDWVARKLEGKERFRAMDEAVAREGWKIVGLTRLSPVFPFNLLNYAFGLTKVSFRAYALASWIGMLPGTVMYVYLGHVFGVAVAAGGERARTPGEWVLLGMGLAATIAVTVFITRIARRALNRRTTMTQENPA